LTQPRLVQADARATGLPAASYDCVFHIGLLEHLECPRPLLVEAVRLLKPGGLQFAVIMPERNTRIRWLALGLLRPWALAREWAPEIVRRRVRAERPSGAPLETILRTGYTRRDYLTMLAGLDVKNVRCLPYNPYHPVYKSDARERAITIPLYRLFHGAKKKLLGSEPSLATRAAFASCDLLTFRKGGGEKQ
jgi:SAM-dependent methyltransferase